MEFRTLFYLTISFVVGFFNTIVQGAVAAGENGLCFRAKSLGHREGNLYYCKDPGLPVCCEKDNTHTCCRSLTERSFNDQALLWGFVCLTALCFAGIYFYFSREGDYWESDTAKEAVDHMARRFGIRLLSRNGGQASDTETKTAQHFDNMDEQALSKQDEKPPFGISQNDEVFPYEGHPSDFGMAGQSGSSMGISQSEDMPIPTFPGNNRPPLNARARPSYDEITTAPF